MHRAIILLTVVAVASARFCMRDEAPTKIKISDKGVPELTCERPTCELKDSKMHSCTYYQESCPNAAEWVSGVHENDNKFGLACCRSPFLAYSRTLGTTKLFAGDVFAGGAWKSKSGERNGFDVVSNIEKVIVDGSAMFRVTVSRVACPKPTPVRSMPRQLINLDQGHKYRQETQHVAGQLQGLGNQGGPFFEDDQFQGQQQQIIQGDAFADAGFGQANGLGNGFGNGLGVAGGAPAVGGLGGLGGLAAAGAACFTEETVVNTDNGPKKMSELNIGDNVMTLDNGVQSFSPVESWLHRLPEKMANFVEMVMEDGTTLTLTPDHFIYHTPCGSNAQWKLSFAKEVIPGEDCVVKVDGESHKQVGVVSATPVVRKGVYGPMTANTNIVVNDLAASCYAVVKDSTLLNSLLSMTQTVDDLCNSALQAFGFQGKTTDLFDEMPLSLQGLMNMGDIVFPSNWKIMG